MPEDLFWPMTLENASERQILIALYKKMERLEIAVTELSQAVSQLQTSVTELTDTVTSQLGPLQDALDAANATIESMKQADELEDAEYKAEIQRLTGELETQVSEANAAAAAITESTAQVQAISQAIDDAVPDVPTDPGGGGEEPSPTGPDGGATGPTGGDEGGGATGPTGPEEPPTNP